MATLPMQQQPGTPPMGGEMAGKEEQAAYEICITVNADGTFDVEKKDKEAVMGDPAVGAPEEPGEQTLDNIGDALKAALDIFEKAGGQAANDQFAQGFEGK